MRDGEPDRQTETDIETKDRYAETETWRKKVKDTK